jgi:hypothetical protein
MSKHSTLVKRNSIKLKLKKFKSLFEKNIKIIFHQFQKFSSFKLLIFLEIRVYFIHIIRKKYTTSAYL